MTDHKKEKGNGSYSGREMGGAGGEYAQSCDYRKKVVAGSSQVVEEYYFSGSCQEVGIGAIFHLTLSSRAGL